MRRRRHVLWLAAGAAVAVAAFWGIGAAYFRDWTLDLGCLTFPHQGYASFLLSWIVFGGAAAGLLTLALAGLDGERTRRAVARLAAYPDRRWVAFAAFFAFGVAMLVRTYLLRGMPLTDDESAYRFMALLLGHGHLTAPSPAMKAFFDRGMMVNDGRFYAQYFLGWPALLAPFALVGLAGVANAVYSALTVPALFAVTRRVATSGWAKVVTVLFVASPMIAVGAAAEGSHPSALMLLAWLAWAALRSGDDHAPWWIHAMIAGLFGLVFFNRPLTALGLGAPLLGLWALQAWRRPVPDRWRALGVFAVPAVALGAAFLVVNLVQNGSPFVTAYQRYYQYARSLGFHHSLVYHLKAGHLPGFHLHLDATTFGPAAAGLLRLSVSLFGWPCAFLFAAAAVGRPRARVFWVSAALFVLLLVPTSNPGIDTYGPVHLVELALPILVLTGVGLHRLRAALPERWEALPLAAVVALTLVAAAGYLPVRFRAIAQVTDQTAATFGAVTDRNPGRAVVFSPQPFVHYCRPGAARGFVFFPPTNAPDLSNRILWVNDLGVAADTRFARAHPDRSAWILFWDRCQPRLISLAEAASASHN